MIDQDLKGEIHIEISVTHLIRTSISLYSLTSNYYFSCEINVKRGLQKQILPLFCVLIFKALGLSQYYHEPKQCEKLYNF